MKCPICNNEYTVTCDYNQGRCPNHSPMINSHSIRFITLIGAIKDWFKK
jgi:hypothetical protein